MAISFTAAAAIALYLGAAILHFTRLRTGQQRFNLATIILVILALSFHGSLTYYLMVTTLGINLSFFNVAALMFWLMGIFSLSAIGRGKPIENLTLALYPFSALSIGLATWIPTHSVASEWSASMTAHIVASITAYGILTIAALQAVSLAIQEYALKNRKMRNIINALPPLQTMEELLFEMLWLGISLLTISIATGYFFLEDIFAQHLAHKTVFTLCSWIIFAILLWGRYKNGWRGKTAVRWTLSGFFILMLAYFGSKFVLEMVLHKT